MTYPATTQDKVLCSLFDFLSACGGHPIDEVLRTMDALERSCFVEGDDEQSGQHLRAYIRSDDWVLPRCGPRTLIAMWRQLRAELEAPQ